MLLTKFLYRRQIIIGVKTMVYSLVLCLIFTLLSCNTTKISENKAFKQDNFNQIERFIEKQNYRIEIETVYPMVTNATATVLNNLFLNGSTGDSVGRIDVQGDGFYLEINQDKAKAALPFFGEKQIVTSYNLSDDGIKFDDKHRNYTLTKNEKKLVLQTQFDINDNTESYQITTIIKPSKKVQIIITSSHFVSISYEGKLVMNN